MSKDEHLVEEEDIEFNDDDTVIGVAFRRSLILIGIVAVVILVGYFATRESESEPVVFERGRIEAPDVISKTVQGRPEVSFTDITSQAGLDFVHNNGAVGEKLLPETMGGGVAFFDFDNDNDQDILFVNSDHWEKASGKPASTMGLYRNDGGGRFENITAGSGLDVSFYGMGAACGDYDGDGLTDVFLSAYGPNRLFRNLGDGRFQDVTAKAGVAGEPGQWSTSSGFFDFDKDGDLDLFVCNYVTWTAELDRKLHFTLNGTDRAYGPPLQYAGTFSYLYRNDGGVFTDVSEPSGIQVRNADTNKPMGKALAVIFDDVDGDGHLDIFVANDTVRNFLFRNLGDGRFEEIGVDSGVAFDNMGSATGAMGVDVADFRGDGLAGFAIGNFANESSSLYVRQSAGEMVFVDMANAEGVGGPSRLKLSFGLFFFDHDLDGRLDLLQVNGHLDESINEVQASQHYRQPAQLFWNNGSSEGAAFTAIPDSELGDLAKPIVGRGAAYADIDGDGDLDVLFTQIGGPPLLLRNESSSGHHWLTCKLVGGKGNHEAIGARLELTVDGKTQYRTVMPTKSYLSQTPLPVTFGLGPADSGVSLKVIWPDGAEQNVPINQVDTLVRVEKSTP